MNYHGAVLTPESQKSCAKVAGTDFEALCAEGVMANVDCLIDLIQQRKYEEALAMLYERPELATSHSEKAGQSPLHRAAHCNAAEVCELLIELGADVNVTATNWWLTPLAWAADAGSAEAVELLLQHGAHVNQDAVAGTTALHAAAMGGSSGGSRSPEAYRRTAEILIGHGADINRRATGDRGQRPLDDAIAAKNDSVAAVLRERGAEVSNPSTPAILEPLE